MDDKRIAELFLARDESAVSEAQTAYGAYLHSIARNILGSESDAEECVNDVLLAAWSSLKGEEPRSLKAYLARLTRNAALNALKKNGAIKRGGEAGRSVALEAISELSAVVSGFGDPWDSLRAKELTEAIDGFLTELPDHKRRLFVSRYWYFDDMKTAARLAGMSENRAAVTLFRLREKLKKYLTERGFDV